MTNANNTAGARFGRGFGVVVLGLSLALGACDTESLVELPDPDLITIGTVLDTTNLDALRNGVLFEFARAYSGPSGSNSIPGIVGLSGLMADEMWYASTFTGMRDIDERAILDTNGEVGTVYGYIHRARNLSSEALRLYDEAGQGDTEDAALLTNLNAYSYVFFAENFCSGVPFSSASLGGQITYSGGISTEAMLNEAITRFDAAIVRAQDAGSAEQEAVARIGKARALQDLGQFTEAAAEAALVPDDVDFNVSYSANTSGQTNGIWSQINSTNRTSVATNEGTNGLVFFNRGATNETVDPRVPVDSLGFGTGSQIPLYAQMKYPTQGDDIPLATSVEARLIEAEGALDMGNSAAYLPILNDLRADAGITGTLTDPGTVDGRVLQLYEERAFWLWLTAHRLGDLRRLIDHYGFDQADIYPIGTTLYGTLYGDDVSLLIPDEEENNPEYQGSCFEPEA
jgi:starch-binding outer membrane protein, SusD/RagB family